MGNHQASEQMIGYIYQIRYALYLLLENEDDEAKISIEKFDDVAFTKDDNSSNTFIQLKHHTKSYGNLTDSSTDIWRTINVWINELKKDISLLDNTKFLIITTALSPNNSASHLLKFDPSTRDAAKAYELLNSIAKNSENKQHTTYYKNFTDNSDKISQKLIEKIYIIDKSSNIQDTSAKIQKKLRFSCKPQYLQPVFERLEGWWNNKAIEALCSETPTYVNVRQITSFIVDISQEYSADNLPIDIDLLLKADFDYSSYDERIFFEQLKLINTNKNKMKIALRDYYRAFMQRANWVRDDLLYLNELDRYEATLIDEWEHSYADMLDEIDETDQPDDTVKSKLGKQLFKQLENQDIRIRERCAESFVMRGSYHILADQLKIGWHSDFNERLKYLLEDEVAK